MEDQEQLKRIAKLYLRLAGVPVFATAEVAAAAGVPEGTIRQWVNRGHLELRLSERPGPGKAMFFSSNDLLELMAFAELSKLGLSPSRFAGTAAAMVMSAAGTKISEIAGTWGPLSPESEALGRYVILFYNPHDKHLDWSILPVPQLSADSAITTWTVVDCHSLAKRALEFLSTLKKGADSE